MMLIILLLLLLALFVNTWFIPLPQPLFIVCAIVEGLALLLIVLSFVGPFRSLGW